MTADDAFHLALSDALRSLSGLADPLLVHRLEQHWDLVRRWSPRLNLTAVDDDAEAAWTHYRDSLEALGHLPPGPLVDIGSGAGYPGLVLAAAEPTRPVTLLEPRRKRASFLRTAAATMGLSAVEVLELRADAKAPRLFRAAVTRATFSAYDDLAHCMAWLEPGGVLMAYRSDELASPIPSTIHHYQVLGRHRVLQSWRR